MISFSAHTQLKIKNKMNSDLFNTTKKISYWRQMINNLSKSFVDPLKLELLKYPVLVHANDLNKRTNSIKKESRRIVKKILSPITKQQRLLLRLANSDSLKRLIKTKTRPLSQEDALVENLVKEHSINAA